MKRENIYPTSSSRRNGNRRAAPSESDPRQTTFLRSPPPNGLCTAER